MYWYKQKSILHKAVMALAIAALFLSCTPHQQGGVINETYFDIPTYFKGEITRLTRDNPLVNKTVVKDSLSETKEIKIADWGNELSSFVSIDLNKPVYAGVLQKDSTANRVKITVSDPKVDISFVEITYGDNGEPTLFHIERKVENFLYDTRETLHYETDKGYRLEKHQSVRILGDKYYRIEGRIMHQTLPEK